MSRGAGHFVQEHITVIGRRWSGSARSRRNWFLHGDLDVAAAWPFVAGMQTWNFADFKTGQGTGQNGSMNLKGAFFRDRRPKMAAHFLRSRWKQA